MTISEVRPDGKEIFVQSGWLRASMRKLDASKSHRPGARPEPPRQGRAPLKRPGDAKVTIPLYYEGHVYRAGSRIRVTLGPPRGDQPVWAFANTVPKTGTPKIDGHRRAPDAARGRRRDGADAAARGVRVAARGAVPLTRESRRWSCAASVSSAEVEDARA